MPPVWPPPRPRAQQGEVLALQRKLALQYDGLQQAMNARFDLFHRELALIRTTLLAEPERILVPQPRRVKAWQVALLGALVILAVAAGSLLAVLAEPYGAWLRELVWP